MNKSELTAGNEVIIGREPLCCSQGYIAECLNNGQIDVPDDGPSVQPRLLALPLWIFFVVHESEQHEGNVIGIGNILKGREQISNVADWITKEIKG